MIQAALVFGLRLSLLIATLSVAYAFSKAALRFVTSKGWGAHHPDRLAAGICLIAIGSASANTTQILIALMGPETVEVFAPAAFSMFAGLILLICGYFLNFTAWLAATRNAPIKRVATACGASIVLVMVSGAAAYYAL